MPISLQNAFLSKILVYVSKTFRSAKNDYRNLSFFSLVFYLAIHFFFSIIYHHNFDSLFIYMYPYVMYLIYCYFLFYFSSIFK